MRASIAMKRGAGLAAGLAVAACVSACGGTHGFEPASADRGTSLGNLLAFNSLSAPSLTKPLDVDEKPTCPDVEVLDGTAASRVYGGSAQTNADVKYQFSLGEVARECSHVGDQLLLKVGIEGRALLGPVGSAGTFSAPVRVAVRRDSDEKAVESKLYQVPVSVPSGEAGAPFSIVSDQIAVPYISARADGDYTVVVGFDPKGSGNVAGDTKTKKRRRS